MSRSSGLSRRTLLRAASGVGAALSLTTVSTTQAHADIFPPPAEPGMPEGVHLDESAWTNGTPTAPGPTVERGALRQLPGGPSGTELFVSNNPESVTAPGWLAQCARTTEARGGSAYEMSGRFSVYAYHQNQTGAPAVLHLLAVPAGRREVLLSARGAAYTNAEYPLIQDPAERAGSGPCYATSLDWARDSLKQFLYPTMARPGDVTELARVGLAKSAIVDALWEVTASSGVYLFTVLTADGDLDTATRYAFSDTAFATGNIISQTPTTYGREAGVYAASGWTTGSIGIEVPAPGSYLGLAVNTTSRQVAALDQTVPAVAALRDSSQRSWGNYGMRYDIDMSLHNPSSQPRRVRLDFGSNITAATDVPGDTWNGAMALREGSGRARIATVYTRPTAPLSPLADCRIPPCRVTQVRIRFEVPGLITAGSQLLLRSI